MTARKGKVLGSRLYRSAGVKKRVFGKVVKVWPRIAEETIWHCLAFAAGTER